MMKTETHNGIERKIILDLCGGTGSWSKPYQDAGYDEGAGDLEAQKKQVTEEALTQDREIFDKVLDDELCVWMRKEGYSHGFAEMKKKDILEAIEIVNKTK